MELAGSFFLMLLGVKERVKIIDCNLMILLLNTKGDFQHLCDLKVLLSSVVVYTELKFENKYPHSWDLKLIAGYNGWRLKESKAIPSASLRKGEETAPRPS